MSSKIKMFAMQIALDFTKNSKENSQATLLDTYELVLNALKERKVNLFGYSIRASESATNSSTRTAINKFEQELKQKGVVFID